MFLKKIGNRYFRPKERGDEFKEYVLRSVVLRIGLKTYVPFKILKHKFCEVLVVG